MENLNHFLLCKGSKKPTYTKVEIIKVENATLKLEGWKLYAKSEKLEPPLKVVLTNF